jgi:hypothetical protein
MQNKNEGLRASFGRHESFPLRFGWLTKGFQAWIGNPNVFEEDDAVVMLGVGKNMVNAIRYWMIAAGVATSSGRELKPTNFGQSIFASNGWDPYLEDDATIWLLHWNLACNFHEATTVFWFFNRFHKPEFTSAELAAALGDFAREELRTRSTSATIKGDIALLLRMYEQTAESRGSPIEEALDSPLSLLGLLRPLDSPYHQSRPEFRWRLPVGPFGYALVELFKLLDQPSVPIRRLMHGEGVLPALGSVFRLTEDALVAKLEEFIEWRPGYFDLRETAGMHQVYLLKPVESSEVLDWHYGGLSLREAA